MDEFLHEYEMESLQLGITARRDVVDQLRALFPEGDGGRVAGFLATSKALAARREEQQPAAPRVCRLRVAGSDKDNFHRRLRNIEVAALAGAVLKTRLTGIVALDWPCNRLGEAVGEREDGMEDASGGDERAFRLDAATSIARLLQPTAVYASAIREVDLRGNCLGGESCRLLCAALLEAGESCALRRLSLRGNPLGLAGGHAVAELLGSPACALEELDVGDAQLETANLIAIATALRGNARLRALNLDNPVVQTLEEEAAQHIGKMLQVNDALETLSLAKHQLSDAGALVLAERLLNNAALRSLSLRANRIGAVGAEALAALARRHPALHELDLSANRIGDAGGKALARALAPADGAAPLPALRVLALCSASLADEGVAAVAVACVRQRERARERERARGGADGGESAGGIRSLLLWGNAFGRESARWIAELAPLEVETDVAAWEPDGAAAGDLRIARRDLPADSPAAKFESPKR